MWKQRETSREHSMDEAEGAVVYLVSFSLSVHVVPSASKQEQMHNVDKLGHDKPDYFLK